MAPGSLPLLKHTLTFQSIIHIEWGLIQVMQTNNIHAGELAEIGRNTVKGSTLLNCTFLMQLFCLRRLTSEEVTKCLFSAGFSYMPNCRQCLIKTAELNQTLPMSLGGLATTIIVKFEGSLFCCSWILENWIRSLVFLCFRGSTTESQIFLCTPVYECVA